MREPDEPVVFDPDDRRREARRTDPQDEVLLAA
jgi:hypothetical protein